MSEPMFPAPDADAAPAAAVVDEPTRSNRTPLLVLGGILGAVVVGGGAFLLLSGGGDTAVPTAAPTQSPAPAPSASASPTTSPAAKPVALPATTGTATPTLAAPSLNWIDPAGCEESVAVATDVSVIAVACGTGPATEGDGVVTVTPSWSTT